MEKSGIIDRFRPPAMHQEILRLRESDGHKFFEAFKNRLVETVCPACGSAGEYRFSKYGFKHDECTNCRTLFCNPRPSPEDLNYFYNHYDSPKAWTDLLVNTDANRRALQYDPRVAQIVGFLKSEGLATLPTAVDVGCGSGAFMVSLKRSGFFGEVFGLDLSKNCVIECEKQGLNARQGTLDFLAPQSVDIVFTNDLIEHLFDPTVFLRQVASVLKPGGYVCIACPNGEGFDFQVLRERTKNITPPEHLNYFNPNSMSVLLERTGFEARSVETPGVLDVPMIERDFKAGLDLKTDNRFLDFLFRHGSSEMLEKFQTFLKESRLSSHMLVIARVKPQASRDGR